MMRSRTKQTKPRLLGAAVIAAVTMAASPWAHSEQVWSPNAAKHAMLSGAPVIAKRIASADPAQYCDVASTPGTHFTWVDTTGGLDYNHAWALWAASCPSAVATMRGAEVMYIERVEPISGAIPVNPKQRELTAQELQKAADGGAVVLMVPVDTAEQAKQVVQRAYYPPHGARRFGPGQFDVVYGGVTANYRRTYNDNLVLIAIVSTVEGAHNAKKIAEVKGIHALFMDAMNLESSSGYTRGSPDYEQLAQAISKAAKKTEHKYLCTADRSATPHTLTCASTKKGKDDDDDDD